MENVRRYRALASLCRQQAAYRPLQNWELLGQAEHFEHLAEVELKAHFAACNAKGDEDAIAAAAWEAPVRCLKASGSQAIRAGRGFRHSQVRP